MFRSTSLNSQNIEYVQNILVQEGRYEFLIDAHIWSESSPLKIK